jgi:hypothetical protein
MGNLRRPASDRRNDRHHRQERAHSADDIPFKTKDGNDIRIDVIFTYRVDPQRAPYIEQFVAKDMLELKEKVFRTVARSKPRDYLGEYAPRSFTTRKTATKPLKTLSRACRRS